MLLAHQQRQLPETAAAKNQAYPRSPKPARTQNNIVGDDWDGNNGGCAVFASRLQ
jgi:hypothetical protein